jgi:GTP-binding protein EngB required for normal cell division
VCNRKDLAYVSKRPGKTQQFNYFLVNDKTKSAFYMVDVPGVGYAKVGREGGREGEREGGKGHGKKKRKWKRLVEQISH